MQHLTYETMFEYIVSLAWKTVRHLYCEKKTCPYTTFWLMEMCLSTVWHLVFHYSEWCKGTVGVFTLKDVTRTCLGATFDIRSPCLCALFRHDRDVRTQNVQLKRARTQLWHASMHFFYLRRRVYMSFFDIWGPLSVSPTLLLLFLERMSPRNFWHIRQRLCATAWLDQHACTQAYRLVVGQSPWTRAWIAQPIGCTTRSVDDTKATLQ